MDVWSVAISRWLNVQKISKKKPNRNSSDDSVGNICWCVLGRALGGWEGDMGGRVVNRMMSCWVGDEK